MSEVLTPDQMAAIAKKREDERLAAEKAAQTPAPADTGAVVGDTTQTQATPPPNKTAKQIQEAGDLIGALNDVDPNTGFGQVIAGAASSQPNETVDDVIANAGAGTAPQHTLGPSQRAEGVAPVPGATVGAIQDLQQQKAEQAEVAGIVAGDSPQPIAPEVGKGAPPPFVAPTVEQSFSPDLIGSPNATGIPAEPVPAPPSGATPQLRTGEVGAVEVGAPVTPLTAEQQVGQAAQQIKDSPVGQAVGSVIGGAQAVGGAVSGAVDAVGNAITGTNDTLRDAPDLGGQIQAESARKKEIATIVAGDTPQPIAPDLGGPPRLQPPPVGASDFPPLTQPQVVPPNIGTQPPPSGEVGATGRATLGEAGVNTVLGPDGVPVEIDAGGNVPAAFDPFGPLVGGEGRNDSANNQQIAGQTPESLAAQRTAGGIPKVTSTTTPVTPVTTPPVTPPAGGGILSRIGGAIGGAKRALDSEVGGGSFADVAGQLAGAISGEDSAIGRVGAIGSQLGKDRVEKDIARQLKEGVAPEDVKSGSVGQRGVQNVQARQTAIKQGAANIEKTISETGVLDGKGATERFKALAEKDKQGLSQYKQSIDQARQEAADLFPEGITLDPSGKIIFKAGKQSEEIRAKYNELLQGFVNAKIENGEMGAQWGKISSVGRDGAGSNNEAFTLDDE
jgi:hypothetical protein